MKIFVGTDIESVDRFKKLIELKDDSLKKVFFENELTYAQGRIHGDQSLAGIWCAKEAVVKAFSEVKLITTREVEILCTKNSAPKVLIKVAQLKSLNFNISVSISHTKQFATAVALVTVPV